jgi:hypothetical protein
MYVKRFVGGDDASVCMCPCVTVCVCVYACMYVFFIFYPIKKLKINNELSLQLLYYEYIERPLAAFLSIPDVIFIRT